MGHPIESLIDACAATTESKGFDVSNTPAQLLLMGTEIGEALENLLKVDDMSLSHFVTSYIRLCQDVENSRKCTRWESGYALVPDDNVLEELADVCIRIFSYVGGNKRSQEFVDTLLEKMMTNADRPHMHGKRN